MSTPSRGSLSFNATWLCLYRRPLSITQGVWAGRPLQLPKLLCVLLYPQVVGYRECSSKKSLIIELKCWNVLHPVPAHWGEYAWSPSWQSCPSHVATYCASQQTVLPWRGWSCQSLLLPKFILFLNNPNLSLSVSLSAVEFSVSTASSPSLRGCLYSRPLKVHSLAWRHREKKIKVLKAGLDHRWKK